MAETPLRPGGDVNRGTTLVVLCGIFGFISTTMTIIRIIVRRLSRQLGWDDLAISAATIFLITGEVFNGLSYRSGYGRHAVYLYSRATQNYTEVGISHPDLFISSEQFDKGLNMPLHFTHQEDRMAQVVYVRSNGRIICHSSNLLDHIICTMSTFIPLLGSDELFWIMLGP